MFILKYGSILSFIRKPLLRFNFFKDLFNCALCLGFWVGLFHGIFLYFFAWENIYYLMPLFSSCMCWFGDHVLMFIQAYGTLVEKKIKS